MSLDIYRILPLQWQQPVRDDSSEFQELVPPFIGQAEDVLSESNVQNGYPSKAFVTTESLTVSNIIFERLKATKTAATLAELFGAVESKRLQLQSIAGPSQFKPPPRVTLNEQKKEIWISELANPDIPLQKLAKNVPHGYKADKLLDMLAHRKVPVSRAVWYIRAIGANELYMSKTKSASISFNSHAAEWTNTMMEHLKRILNEVSLPSLQPSRPGINIKGKMRATLQEGEMREKWLHRFTYAVQLYTRMQDEHLIDNAIAFEVLINLAKTCHLGQLGFVLDLIDQSFEDIIQSTIWTSTLVESLCARLDEVVAQDDAELHQLLKRLIQTIFDREPQNLLCPQIWLSYRSSLLECLRKDDDGPNNGSDDLDTVLERVAFVMGQQSEQTGSKGSISPQAMYIIILDQFCTSTKYATFTSKLSRIKISLSTRVDLINSWATCLDRKGAYRIYVASQLYRSWLAESSNSEMKALTQAWLLSDSTLQVSPGDVVLLYTELANLGLFDLQSFLRYVTTSGININPTIEKLLLEIPVMVPSLVFQRTRLLQMDHDSAAQQSQRMRRAQAAVDGLFEASPATPTFVLALQELKTAFERSAVLTLFFERLDQLQIWSMELNTIVEFSVFLRNACEYRRLSLWLQHLLNQSHISQDLLLALIDTCAVDLLLWNSMGWLSIMANCVLSAQIRLQSSGASHCPFIGHFLEILKRYNCFETTAASSLSAALSTRQQLPQTRLMPAQISELNVHITNPSSTARSLYSRYASCQNWEQAVIGLLVHKACTEAASSPAIAEIITYLHAQTPHPISVALTNTISYSSEKLQADSLDRLVDLLVELANLRTLQLSYLAKHILLPIYHRAASSSSSDVQINDIASKLWTFVFLPSAGPTSIERERHLAAQCLLSSSSTFPLVLQCLANQVGLYTPIEVINQHIHSSRFQEMFHRDPQKYSNLYLSYAKAADKATPTVSDQKSMHIGVLESIRNRDHNASTEGSSCSSLALLRQVHDSVDFQIQLQKVRMAEEETDSGLDGLADRLVSAIPMDMVKNMIADLPASSAAQLFTTLLAKICSELDAFRLGLSDEQFTPSCNRLCDILNMISIDTTQNPINITSALQSWSSSFEHAITSHPVSESLVQMHLRIIFAIVRISAAEASKSSVQTKPCFVGLCKALKSQDCRKSVDLQTLEAIHTAASLVLSKMAKEDRQQAIARARLEVLPLAEDEERLFKLLNTGTSLPLSRTISGNNDKRVDTFGTVKTWELLDCWEASCNLQGRSLSRSNMGPLNLLYLDSQIMTFNWPLLPPTDKDADIQRRFESQIPMLSEPAWTLAQQRCMDKNIWDPPSDEKPVPTPILPAPDMVKTPSTNKRKADEGNPSEEPTLKRAKPRPKKKK